MHSLAHIVRSAALALLATLNVHGFSAVAHAQAAAPQAVAPSLKPGLTLEEAVRLALARSEGARAAELQLRAAEARVDRAEAFFIPEVTATGSYGTHLYEIRPEDSQRPIQGGRGFRGELTIAATLFDGRGFPLLSQAKLSRDAQRLETADQKRLLAFDTASLFLAALSQEAVLTAAKTRVDLARASATDAEGRFQAGIASSNDVTRVQLELAAAQRDVATAEAERLRARLRVAHILDTPIDPNRPFVLPEALLTEALVQADTSVRPAATEATRLDVQALGKRAEAADAFAQEPNWRLAPTAGVQYRAYEGSLTFVLTWTLFDGGERYAERDERLALAAVAELDVDAAARRASTETTDAMIGLSAARTVLEQAERTAEIARANNRETAELYRQGLSTALAIADASARLFDAEVALARSRYALAVSLLDLRRAYGLDPFGKEPL